MVKIIKLNAEHTNKQPERIHIKSIKKKSPKRSPTNRIPIHLGKKVLPCKTNFEQPIQLTENTYTKPPPTIKKDRLLTPPPTIKKDRLPANTTVKKTPRLINKHTPDIIQVRTHKTKKKIPTISIDIARNQLLERGVIKKNIPDKMVLDMYTLCYDKNINLT